MYNNHSNTGGLSWLIPVTLLVAAMLIVACTDAARSEDHSNQGHAHGGMKMPYDPYIGSDCCNNADCRAARHRIVGSKLYVETEGEVLEFDLSDQRIKVWAFNPTQQEVLAGAINPAFEAFRKRLEKTWHWCGYREKGTIMTRCILRPHLTM